MIDADFYNFVDREVNDLKDNLSKTGGSLDNLYKLLVKNDLDKKINNIYNFENNLGLLYKNPNYKAFNYQSSVYNYLISIIDLFSFTNINDFNEYMSFLNNHKSVQMLEYLEKIRDICSFIFSIEGIHFYSLSEYSIPYAKKLNEDIPKYFGTKEYKKFLELFPYDLTKADGDTINDLYVYVGSIEKGYIADIKEDIFKLYDVEMNLFDESFNDKTLGLLIRIIKDYNSKEKVKK